MDCWISVRHFRIVCLILAFPQAASSQPMQNSIDDTPLSGAVAGVADTATTFASPTVLGVYDAESDNAMTVVTARLSTRPSWQSPSIEEHGSFLQVVLPDTIVPHPGQFIDGRGPWVKKLAAYQLSPTDAALRIFVHGSAADILKATTAELLNDRVVISLEHRDLPSPTETAQPASVELKEAEKPSALTPADLAKGTTGISGSSAPDFSSKLNAVAIFSAIMLFGLVTMHGARIAMRRRKKAGGAFESFDIKSLASFAVAPKQRLMLVEVCSERILLAVSPSQVNFITSFGASTRRAVVHGAPEPAIGLPAEVQPYFQRSNVTANHIEMKQVPTPVASVAEREEQKRPPQSQPIRNSGTSEKPIRHPRINYAVTDAGIQHAGPAAAKDISDVTKIIREKLKGLGSLTPQAD